MGVKVRQFTDGWYVVIHFQGKRKTAKCESEETAYELAQEIQVQLQVLGSDAFDRFGKKEKVPSPEPAAPKFSEYAEKWLAEARQSDLKFSTLLRYESSLRTHLIPEFGGLPLDQITYSQLKELCIKTSSRLSRDSVRLMIAALRVVMKEAVREGLINANPVNDLGKYYGKPKQKREVYPFTSEELSAIEEVCRCHFPTYYEFVLCAARTGLRFGEERALQWPDFNFKERVIHIRRNWPAAGHLTTPKTKRSRRKVDMSNQLSQAMKELQERRETTSGKAENPDWTFLSSRGEVIDHSHFVKQVWDRVQELAGVKRRNWHNLRHTYASQLLIKGVSPVYVSHQLGHSSLTTTLNVYAHWIREGGKNRYVDLLDENGED